MDAITSNSATMTFVETGRTWARPPVKHPRAIVSVAFPGKDYDAVEIAAERMRLTISQFIREAALTHARDVR